MRISSPSQLQSVENFEQLRRFVTIYLTELTRLINGNLNFGENILNSPAVVTFPAAGQDVVVPHKLGFIPNGYLVSKRSDNFVIYDGAQANTNEVLYVRASAAGTASLIIF